VRSAGRWKESAPRGESDIRNADHHGGVTRCGEARKKLKAPGYDGISHGFFQLSWETIKDVLLAIVNQMYMDEAILDSQKHVIIVCIPRTHKSTSPEDYRPLKLMNSDFKLLSRIIANRLRHG
jgi:hypothetical protein